MTKMKANLVLSGKQIQENVKEQMEFLKLIHPSATGEGFKEGTIEIRFLRRSDEGSKSERSFNTWSLNEKDEEVLLKRMLENNGVPCCTYYSAFAFEKSAKGIGQVNKENALYTTILPMDFDGISEKEYLVEKQRFMDLGIETYDVFTGHGFQALILLNRKSFDKQLFTKFTELLLKKGFPVDEKIKDAARVLRLPMTFNCKQFLKGDKNYNTTSPEGVPTYVYSKTEKRYDSDLVFEKLNGLADVEEVSVEDWLENLASEKKGNNVAKIIAANPRQEQKEVKEMKVFATETKETPNVKVVSKEEWAERYVHINYNKLPQAMQLMLMGSRQGLRNDVLFCVLPYFRNTLGLSIDKVKKTMRVWGELCTPKIDSNEIDAEVERLFKYNFEAKHGLYTEDLKKEYGELEFLKLENDDEIIISNGVFEKVKDISDGAFQLFLTMKLLEHLTKNKNFTVDEICKAAGIAERTFRKHIPFLTKHGLVTKKRCRNKQSGEKYLYYINPYNSSVKGFTKVKASLIRLLLKENFTGGETTFYMYMKHMVGDTDKSCWASQTYIAKALGKKSHSTISKMTDTLHANHFILKKTDKVGLVKHSTYTLLM